MGSSEFERSPNTAIGARFAATSWTNVMVAQQQGSAEAEAALERLCKTYWYPLYAYLRRKGNDPHRAQDLTQGFLYTLIKDNYLGAADRRRGKFRSFLLSALNHFVSNQRDYERAVKRGGRMVFVSLEDQDSEGRYKCEPASDQSPEKTFERNWFMALFDEALQRLRTEQVKAGKVELFDVLKQFLVGDAEQGEYNTVASQLNMKPNAVAVAVHRLRERYRKLVHEEVLRTVADESELQDELHRFFALMEK